MSDMDDATLKAVIGFLAIPFIVILALFLYLFVAPIFALIFAYPIMFVWNMVIPQVFGLPHLTFWQAWALDLVVTWLGLRKIYST